MIPVFAQTFQREFIHGVGKDQRLDALAAETLKVRVEQGGFPRGRGDVPDMLLIRFHAAQVFVKTGQFGVFALRSAFGRPGGGEAHERRYPVTVDKVVEGEFEVFAVQLPERGILFLVILRHAFQMTQHLPYNGLRNLAQYHVFLQRFAGDVQGQVFCVHHTLEEGKVVGNEVMIVLGDEHAPYIQIQPPFVPLLAEQILFAVRNENQRGELHRRVHGKMNDIQRRFGVVGQIAVKVVVLFFFYGEFRLPPQRRSGVETFTVNQNGEGQEIGMPPDH